MGCLRLCVRQNSRALALAQVEHRMQEHGGDMDYDRPDCIISRTTSAKS